MRVFEHDNFLALIHTALPEDDHGGSIMLVNTRRIGQSLRIGDNTIIKVVDSGAGKAVLQITSTQTITVDDPDPHPLVNRDIPRTATPPHNPSLCAQLPANDSQT